MLLAVAPDVRYFAINTAEGECDSECFFRAVNYLDHFTGGEIGDCIAIFFSLHCVSPRGKKYSSLTETVFPPGLRLVVK